MGPLGVKGKKNFVEMRKGFGEKTVPNFGMFNPKIPAKVCL